MAIYHFTAKVISRARGQSAIAKAAYNSRARIADERTGDSHDYRRKGGLVFSGIFAPKDAPEWVHDRARLYNEIERGEKRKDAQLVREVEIALPHELTLEQRERLVKDFMREQFVRKGMIADVAIHEPDKEGDERNHHAHILLTMRAIGPDGFGAKVRDWNGKEQLESWRDAWERTANRYLEKHGHEARIDRRTLEGQGIAREPTRHRGPEVDAMEKDGISTDRGREGRETDARNAALAELRAELVVVQNHIRALELDAYLDGVDRDRANWDSALHDAAVEKEKIERRFTGPIETAREEIREAYVRSDGAREFRAALAERGFWLARADTDDVEDSKFDHGRLERQGRTAPVFELGEYVAVDTLGRTFMLGYATTGESRENVATLLRELDREAVPTIAETRAEFLPPWIEREPRASRESPAPVRGPSAGAAFDYLTRGAERALGKTFDLAADGAEMAIEAAAASFESLFDAVPPSPMRTRSMPSREPDPKPDLKRYLADDDYRRQMAQREIEERQRREREYYVKQKERER